MKPQIDESVDKGESGFSLVDVLIAISVLMVGILALLSAMTVAIVGTTQSSQQATAKQFAVSTMESIFSARDINNPIITSFSVIANDTTTGGIFLSGDQPIYNSAGCDGVIGTKDDSWGADCAQGTTDDLTAVPGFRRTIAITAVQTNVIQIVVTITYQVNGHTYSEQLTSFMGNYNTQTNI